MAIWRPEDMTPQDVEAMPWLAGLQARQFEAGAFPKAVLQEVTQHPLCHEESGEECTLGHLEGGACQVCKHCREKVRPKNMGEKCPARQGVNNVCKCGHSRDEHCDYHHSQSYCHADNCDCGGYHAT